MLQIGDRVRYNDNIYHVSRINIPWICIQPEDTDIWEKWVPEWECKLETIFHKKH